MATYTPWHRIKHRAVRHREGWYGRAWPPQMTKFCPKTTMNNNNTKNTLKFFLQKSTCGQNETSFLIHAGEETAEFWSEVESLVQVDKAGFHPSYHQTEKLVSEALDLVVAIDGILVHNQDAAKNDLAEYLRSLTRPRTLLRWLAAYDTLRVLGHNGVGGTNPLFRSVLAAFNEKLKRKGCATLDWHLAFADNLDQLELRARGVYLAVYPLRQPEWKQFQEDAYVWETLLKSVRQYWVDRKWWDNVLRGCSDSELILETGDVILEVRVGRGRKPPTD